MLCVIIPAIGRLPIPPIMITWVIFALSLAGLMYDAVATRQIYLTNVIGIVLINICFPLRFIIADNRTWQESLDYNFRVVANPEVIHRPVPHQLFTALCYPLASKPACRPS